MTKVFTTMIRSKIFIATALACLCLRICLCEEQEVLDLEKLCIDEILEKISRRAINCVNVTEFFLNRIRLYNPVINAVITTDEVGARLQAQHLDEAFQQTGRLYGSLHCIPVLVKDNIMVRGLPVTLGLAVFADSIAEVDAPAVEKLREAGAVILGKANMAAMALGTAGERSQTGGVVHNPYALNYSAASSSNGNAAALAARLAVIGVASDSSGSVTGPASVTYTVGFRPPANAFDMTGLLPLRGPVFDTMGLLALRAKDVVTVLEVLSTEGGKVNFDPNKDAESLARVRVGIVGNLTYGEVTNKYGYYKLKRDIQEVFWKFENGLRALENVSVDVTWDDEIIDRVFEMTKDFKVLCSCFPVWLEQFWADFPMTTATSGRRITNLTEVVEAGLCLDGSGSGPAPCTNDNTYAEWQKWVGACDRKASLCEQQHSTALNRLLKVQSKLEEGLFSKFDVVVLTQKPQALTRSRSDGDLFISDFGSSFAYPSLVVPIGFTDPAEDPPLPITAYFVSPPDKTPLMLSVARRYEEMFWSPKVPDSVR